MSHRETTVVHPRPNRELMPYLSTVGVAGHFARYVVACRPEAESPAAMSAGPADTSGETVIGAAVSGLPVGLYEAASCWIFADDPATFELLLRQVLADDLRLLNFPIRYVDLVASTAPELTITTDRLYVLEPSRFRPPTGSLEVEHLPRERLAALTIPDELATRVGRIEEIPAGFPLHGIVSNGVLIAIAETAVRDAHVAAIQQVFTLPSERGRGLARAIVATLARDLLAAGHVPTYLVAEANTASVALVESLGFTLDSCWGCAE